MADAYAPYQQQQHQSQQSSGYRHPDPKIGGQRDDNAPSRQNARRNTAGNAQYDPSYFPPPPRSERGYEDGSVRDTASYAGSTARGDDGQALTPYDEEKAYAQYSDAYGPPDYGQRSAPPRSDYDRRYDERSEMSYDDRPRRGERERRHNRRPPPSEYSDYDDYDDDDYDKDRRRRDSRAPRSEIGDDKRKEKRSLLERGKDILKSSDGEPGIGATLLGGAAGAFLGDQVGKGKHGKDSALGTLGGALVGAIGAHAAERQWDKREKSKEEKERSKGGAEERNRLPRRGHTDEYAGGGDDSYYGGRDQSRGAASRDEFRPRRADQRGAPPRRRRRDESSDSYASD